MRRAVVNRSVPVLVAAAIVFGGCAMGGGQPPGACSEPNDSLEAACVHDLGDEVTGTLSGADLDFHRFPLNSGTGVVRELCASIPVTTDLGVDITFYEGESVETAVLIGSGPCDFDQTVGDSGPTYIWYRLKSISGDPHSYTILRAEAPE